MPWEETRRFIHFISFPLPQRGRYQVYRPYISASVPVEAQLGRGLLSAKLSPLYYNSTTLFFQTRECINRCRPLKFTPRISHGLAFPEDFGALMWMELVTNIPPENWFPIWFYPHLWKTPVHLHLYFFRAIWGDIPFKPLQIANYP